jgi:hypothetical protein
MAGMAIWLQGGVFRGKATRDGGYTRSEATRGAGGRRTAMGRMGLALVAAVFFLAVSASSMLTQAQGTTPTEAQRRECERNGGYWDTAAGFCRVGS